MRGRGGCRKGKSDEGRQTDSPSDASSWGAAKDYDISRASRRGRIGDN